MSSPTPSSADTMSLTSNSSEGEPEHTLNTKCGVCNETYTIPKVLPCFHTFCQPCLEKVRVVCSCAVGVLACSIYKNKFYRNELLFERTCSVKCTLIPGFPLGIGFPEMSKYVFKLKVIGKGKALLEKLGIYVA